MTKTTKTILMVVAGLAICAVVVVVGGGIWIYTSAVSSESADEPTALKTLADTRARFAGTAPLIELRPAGPVLTRSVPDGAVAAPLQRVHVLTWNSADQKLSRVTLPFWLIRFEGGPIELVRDEVHAGNTTIDLTVEQIERFGPALLVDHLDDDGTRVLVWTE